MEIYNRDVDKLHKKLSGLFDNPEVKILPKIILHAMLSVRPYHNLKGSDKKNVVIDSVNKLISNIENDEEKKQCINFVELYGKGLIENYYWISKQNPEFNPKSWISKFAC